MPKTIKFNLILDGKPVRDIEGLKENFNIDDLLLYFKSGLLKRWLAVRNISDIIEKLDAIKTDDPIEIAKSLIRVFEIENSKDKILEGVHSFKFNLEKEIALAKFEENNFKEREIIKNYHNGYKSLFESMMEKKDDYPHIKSCINTIHKEYLELFKINYFDFFNKFIEGNNNFPIYAVLMNINLREIFLCDTVISSALKDLIKFEENEMKKILDNYKKNPDYKKKNKFQKDTNHNWEKVTDSEVFILNIINGGHVRIKDNDDNTYEPQQAIGRILNGLSFYSFSSSDCVEYISTEELNLDFPRYFKTFKGDTDSYWKDIEPKDKKFVIISIQKGSLVRNAGKTGEELKDEDIIGKFPILDGIDYKSKTPSHKLIYMEV